MFQFFTKNIQNSFATNSTNIQRANGLIKEYAELLFNDALHLIPWDEDNVVLMPSSLIEHDENTLLNVEQNQLRLEQARDEMPAKRRLITSNDDQHIEQR